MSTEPRTVTVNVSVHKPLEIDEPDWCAGHPADTRPEYKVDIAHAGREHVIAPGGREMFRAYFTQAPFATTDRTIGLYVDVADLTRTRTPAEVEQLADDLTAAAARLRELGGQLAGILAGAALPQVDALGASCAGLGGACVVDHSTSVSNPGDAHCDGPPVTMAGPHGSQFPDVHLSQWTGDVPQMVIGQGRELNLADVDRLLSDLRSYEAHILALRAQLAALLGGEKR